MRRSRVIVGGFALAVLIGAGIAVASGADAAAPADPFSRAVGHVKAHASSTHFGQGQTFTLKNVQTDADGTEHVRMHRYYQGLPVLGGDLVVHMGKSNAFRGVSQTVTGSLNVASHGSLTAQAAAGVALASSKAATRQVDGVQQIVDAGDGPAALAYEVVVGGRYADATPSELHVIVDATSGKIRDSWEGVQNDAGTGNTFHSGSVAIQVAPVTGGFTMTDTTRGGHTTYDLNGATNGTGSLFIRPTTTFGNGTLSDRATTGADAHYGAQVTWDYYLNVHGRNGIRNDGVAAFSRVHYSTNYVNAFWQDSCFCMTYGDGDPAAGWTPLTSLDVAGHEMSHGVTSATANMRYSGEPGGLNEATSDIFGTLVEFFANNTANDPGDYQIGEELRTNGVPLRWMDQPSRDGNSADCWSRTVKRLDVHYSSGVANHFFYLLAVGSGSSSFGNSPTCNGSTVTGIGNTKAGAIWYRALTVYMTSRTNYAGARTATLSAAGDLYGVGSVEYNTVAAAWSAVNVA